MVAGLAMFGALVWCILNTATIPAELHDHQFLTVKAIGNLLMEQYVWPLQCVGLLLTAALIGALIIVMEDKQ